MAHRVVIEEECPLHGGFDPHWSSGQQNSNGPYRACQMSQRRVLDPNSFMDEVAHAVMAWTWTIDAVPDMESPIEGLDLANRILDALTGDDAAST